MTDTNDVFTIDINDLTIGEVVLIEEMTGLPLDALGQPDVPKGKMMQALAFISKKRDDPDFTWEQAGELKINTTSEPVPLEDGDE